MQYPTLQYKQNISKKKKCKYYIRHLFLCLTIKFCFTLFFCKLFMFLINFSRYKTRKKKTERVEMITNLFWDEMMITILCAALLRKKTQIFYSLFFN